MTGENRRPFAFGIRKTKAVDIFFAWLGAALGIGATAYLSNQFFEPRDSILLIGSFGASAVLIYAAVTSPLARPRNLLGSHIISALIGVACYQVIGDGFLAVGLGVSLAITAMMLTDTLHPPGGATSLIAIIGGDAIKDLGFLYVVIPVGLGAVLLLVIALLVTNIPRGKTIPALLVLGRTQRSEDQLVVLPTGSIDDIKSA
jgi:CBS-domain-containing membrane protein